MASWDDLIARVPNLSEAEKRFISAEMRKHGLADHGAFFLHLVREAMAAQAEAA